MFEYNKDIEGILKSRVNSRLLEGYFGGLFNPENDKFYAATLVDINTIDYDEFEYLHEQLGSHSSTAYDFERARNYSNDRSSYTNKTARELVAEGIYNYFSVSFICIHFEEEWFVLKSLCYYGDLITEDGIKQELIKQTNLSFFWEQSLFKPHETPDYMKEKFAAAGYKDAAMEEFKSIPYLVAILKKEKKEKINHAWCHYFNEDFILSFFESLSIRYPTAYRSFSQLRHNFTMIYPALKTQVIFCAFVGNDDQEYFLNYFVFDYRSRKFYKWTYFKPVSFDFSFYYGTVIINDLKQISHWDSESYLDSSCTMDDDNFWNNYVFAQNNGEYVYLQEI